jgi:hypothetical protein
MVDTGGQISVGIGAGLMASGKVAQFGCGLM